jgi:flagellar protein FlaJ
MKKRTHYLVFSMTAILGAIVGIVGFLYFREASYFTGFLLGAFFLAFGPYLFYKFREQAWISEIEDQFPDFLRLLAEAQRAGMTLPQAIYMARGDDYGRLSPEITKMAAQISWGIPFAEILSQFAERSKSSRVQSTVSLIIVAHHAGGDIVKILEAASDSARERQSLAKEQASQMQQYLGIIYMSYFIFIGVVYLIKTQFINVFQDIESPMGGGEPIPIDTYNQLFLAMLLIQGALSGLVAGKFSSGSVFAGIKHSFVLIVVGYLASVFIGIT